MENNMSSEMRKMIDDVASASNGAEIRQPLVTVFNEIFGKGRNAELFNNQNGDFYALQADGVWLFDGNNSKGETHKAGDPRTGISTLLPFDTWATKPKKTNQKLVDGRTIFMVTGDLVELPSEVEEILRYGE